MARRVTSCHFDPQVEFSRDVTLLNDQLDELIKDAFATRDEAATLEELEARFVVFDVLTAAARRRANPTRRRRAGGVAAIRRVVGAF